MLQLTVLNVEALFQYCEVYQLKIDLLLFPCLHYLHLLWTMYILLPYYEGVLNRQCQTQHDQIGISTIEAVSILWKKVLLIGPNKLHYFMLSFSRSIWSCENNRECFPVFILLYFLLNEEVKHLVKLFHERCAWGYGVVFKILLTVYSVSVSIQFRDVLLVLQSTP